MIGILFGLKGSSWDGSYCWLKRDYDVLFARLPDESPLCKALATHRDWYNFLLPAGQVWAGGGVVVGTPENT